MSAKLFMMLGLPGAGKTTTAQLIADLTGAVRLSSDELRFKLIEAPTFTQAEHDIVYRTLDYISELLLSQGISVIYDANLNRFRHRQDKYAICERAGAQAVLVWIKTPRDLAKQRAVHEDRAHFAPKDETLEGMFERITDVFEPPQAGEAPVLIDGTHIDAEIVRQALSSPQLL